jgi:NAD-specific glutamate dehydrogenase
MKYKIHLFLFLPFFLLTQGFAQNSKSIKELLEEGFDINRVYIGVTLYHKELNRKVSELFLEEFTYTPSENNSAFLSIKEQLRVELQPYTKYD